MRPFTNGIKVVRAVGEGRRPKKDDKIKEWWWKLLKDCWGQAPVRRSEFDRIVRMLEDEEGAVLEGADMKEVKNYHDKCENELKKSEMESSRGRERRFSGF